MEDEWTETFRVSNGQIKLQADEEGEITSISDLTDLVKLFIDYSSNQSNYYTHEYILSQIFGLCFNLLVSYHLSKNYIDCCQSLRDRCSRNVRLKQHQAFCPVCQSLTHKLCATLNNSA